MRFAAPFLLAALLPCVAAADVAGPARVIDGDTIVILGETIRLHGIDAPEGSQTCTRASGKRWRCGEASSEALREKVSGSTVDCQGSERDAYGRLIANCSIGVTELNGWLIENGWAVAFRRYSEDYVASEEIARAAKIGIWATEFEMPWDYRAQRWTEAGQTAPDPNCPIKGNINRDGERIYHTPYSRHYDKTKINTAKSERWFCDEQEAIAAGWRAPLNE